MALTNFDTKEINCKILYLGPQNSGKTQNLRSICAKTSHDEDMRMHEFEGAQKSTRYFDFLPVTLGRIRDFQIKLHLYSFPLATPFDSLKNVIVRGVDGFVFVADSRIEMLEDNIDNLKAALKFFREEGYNPFDLSRVLQYNKQDLSQLVPREVLSKELNPSNYPELEAVASQSIGTMETLTMITKQVLKKLAQSAQTV